MITTARLNHGPLLERGCVAWTVSKDLKNWEVKPPLYSPWIGAALEVIELFKMDDRYYLIFCHGETNTTRYRVAERLEGSLSLPCRRRPPAELYVCTSNRYDGWRSLPRALGRGPYRRQR